MAEYLIKRVDPALWQQFKARAHADDISMRTILLTLVRAYLEGSVRITATQTPATREEI